LRPLTLLVGENSTGKTTFLATLANICKPGFPSFKPSFNVPPFDLGTYDSIATYKGGRYGRADSFSLGFEDEGKKDIKRMVATYISSMGQPQLSAVEITSAGTRLFFEMDSESMKGKVSIKDPQGVAEEHTIQFDPLTRHPESMPFLYFLQYLIFESKIKVEIRDPLFGLFERSGFGPLGPVLALAPVRTKPRRTYDEISDEFKPEGDHIPVLLARIWQEKGSSTRERLIEALTEFGVTSSLFEEFGVKRLGKRPSDPFQILVTLAGPPANLPDVGYGVSQALPVIVQSILAEKGTMLLLQQPEVHLHPRGQAALGSFFARLVTKDKKKFVIETHSDYLLDRVRIEVANGRLPFDDVLVLFFDKVGVETHVHEISLDAQGNVIRAPAAYRQFFMEEEGSLMNRAK
jgi:energy-coupling factor transporter ATP-binding protein EcfA2